MQWFRRVAHNKNLILFENTRMFNYWAKQKQNDKYSLLWN